MRGWLFVLAVSTLLTLFAFGERYPNASAQSSEQPYLYLGSVPEPAVPLPLFKARFVIVAGPAGAEATVAAFNEGGLLNLGNVGCGGPCVAPEFQRTFELAPFEEIEVDAEDLFGDGAIVVGSSSPVHVRIEVTTNLGTLSVPFTDITPAATQVVCLP